MAARNKIVSPAGDGSRSDDEASCLANESGDMTAATVARTAGHLEVAGLRFGYSGREVIRDVSFAVEHGDFVGIVGPNGSGKSTLLRLVDAVHKPLGGTVRIDGEDVRRYQRRQLARRVALVPQQFDLQFDFTALEVVQMGRYCRSDKESRKAAMAALETLGVQHLAGRLFPRLSGGQKQMVVLAQALAQEPELLLLDEPVSALDVSHQLEFFDCVRRLNRDGLTVLCVLHDLNLALHYCHRTLILDEGRVAAYGLTDEVLEPEIIEAVYGVGAHIHRHGGRAFLTFSPRVRAARKERVHLVCGGGSGSYLMRELADLGYAVSAGVVNALDADEATGRDLGLALAVEAPFCRISDDAFDDSLALIRESELVILTDVPIGPANARNLDLLRAALDTGKPVWTVAGLADRDFSDGRALLDLPGARQFPDVVAILEELRGR